MVKVKDKIRIIQIDGEPKYSGKVGIVEHIDDIGRIHGTWGSYALIPEIDKYVIVEE